jgi:hypothetical protein
MDSRIKSNQYDIFLICHILKDQTTILLGGRLVFLGGKTAVLL